MQNLLLFVVPDHNAHVRVYKCNMYDVHAEVIQK